MNLFTTHHSNLISALHQGLHLDFPPILNIFNFSCILTFFLFYFQKFSKNVSWVFILSLHFTQVSAFLYHYNFRLSFSIVPNFSFAFNSVISFLYFFSSIWTHINHCESWIIFRDHYKFEFRPLHTHTHTHTQRERERDSCTLTNHELIHHRSCLHFATLKCWILEKWPKNNLTSVNPSILHTHTHTHLHIINISGHVYSIFHCYFGTLNFENITWKLHFDQYSPHF